MRFSFLHTKVLNVDLVGISDKGFSLFAIGKLDPNNATEGEITNPKFNFITSVSLPSAMKKIGSFTNISGELILPGRLETIDDFAFFGCDNISGQLNIPKSIISLLFILT